MSIISKGKAHSQTCYLTQSFLRVQLDVLHPWKLKKHHTSGQVTDVYVQGQSTEDEEYLSGKGLYLNAFVFTASVKE